MTTAVTTTPQAGPMFQDETLQQALCDAEEKGYTEEFRLERGGIRKKGSENVYPNTSMVIDSTYRIEGLSDPAAQVTVYALRAQDGSRGTLVQSYGASADAALIQFMDEVQSICQR